METSTCIKLPNGKVYSLSGIRRLLDALFPENAENRVDNRARWWKTTANTVKEKDFHEKQISKSDRTAPSGTCRVPRCRKSSGTRS